MSSTASGSGRPVSEHTPNTILIVDDDSSFRSILAAILDSHGYRVVEVEQGREALDYLMQGTPPCVVLLDLHMPVMDGWAFMQAKMADPTIAAIPVIVLSADSQALEAAPKAAAYVEKRKVDLANLAELVERYRRG